MKYQNLDELAAKIDENDGVLTIYMQALRDAYGEANGVKRLGTAICSNISRELKSRGISHIPSELPALQTVPVRLYKLGSQVDAIITAATEIGDIQDQKLRSMAASDAEGILRKIRELVEV